MLNERPRRRPATIATTRAVALLLALALVFATTSQAGAAPTSAPSSTPAPSTPSASKPGPTFDPNAVAFGIGPANAKGADGRSSLNYGVDPGSRTTDHLVVSNFSSNKTLTLVVYAADAVEDSTGHIGYNPRAKPGTDSSRWVTFDKGAGLVKLTLHPGQKLVLQVNVAVPTTATPGDHLAGIFAGLIAQAVGTGQQQQQLNFEQRVALRAYFRVSGIVKPALTIAGLKAKYHDNWNPIGRGSATVSYTVRNTGNVTLGGPQSVKISGLFGATGSKVAVADVPMLLPGASAAVRVKVKSVSPEFVMHAKVTVDTIGLPSTVNPGITIARAGASFWAIPWMLLIIVVLILGAIVWTIVRNRGPRRGYQPQRRAPKKTPALSGTSS